MSVGVAPLLECRGIGKRFGGEVALEAVDFDLDRGEIHGLVGSNGAGKSTLMKILAGVLPDHEGTIRLDGRPVRLTTPRLAAEQGIAMVYQELSGIGQLSVAENLFLGRQPTTTFRRIDWTGMFRKAEHYLGELRIEVDIRRRLDAYPLVIRQMVEIARGLHSGARILILDEPTSALSPPEVHRLLQLLGQLKARGVAIVFISHFIEDVLQICDRVTVLRDGRQVETKAATSFDKHSIIHKMLGHQLRSAEPGYETGVTLPPRNAASPRLCVKGLSRSGSFDGIDFDIAPGECVGLYGFVGSGHQELAHAIAGALKPSAGQVLLDGVPLKPGDVHSAVRRGVVLVAADRSQSLVHAAQVSRNLTLPHLCRAVGNWLTRRRESAVARPILDKVACRPAQPELPARSLSGGNQQKVVLGRWLLGPMRVLVLEEPTRGMDVGAKEEIMQLVRGLKADGVTVLLASSEPELVLAHSDRILVLHRGRIAAHLADTFVDKAILLKHA